jgi:hypothetical protein
MDLVYQAIHAALLPVRLHDLPKFIGLFVEHVGHRQEKKRPKQTEVFREQLQALPSVPSGAARRPLSTPDCTSP